MRDEASVLEIHGDLTLLRQSLRPAGAATSSVHHVEEAKPDAQRVRDLSRVLIEELQRQCSSGAGAGDREIARLGQCLYDELLAGDIKKRMSAGDVDHLAIVLDEALAFVPWELLHDGRGFLCQNAALGRVVRTRETASDPPPRPPAETRSLLVLANPTGDLPGALREQEEIRVALRVFGQSVSVRAKAGRIDREFVLSRLREHDALHYSGHAQHAPEEPARSGWLLSDGVLCAADVARLAGGRGALPLLVFANACRSSGPGAEESGDAGAAEYHLSMRDLSSAFLLGGVRAFIGTLTDVPDDVAACFSARFYRLLFQGESVGRALRQARAETAEKFAGGAPGWLTYVLYGDPAERPFARTQPDETPVSSGARSGQSVRTRSAMRCALCQEQILSRLADAYYACEECGLPICRKCWVARGVRRCAAHAGELNEARAGGAEQPTDAVPAGSRATSQTPAQRPQETCAHCGRARLSEKQIAGRCQEPGCQAPICANCWRFLDRRVCAAHAASESERLARARAALQRGEIPLLVDRATACVREAAYVAEMMDRLRGCRKIRVNGEALALGEADVVRGADEEGLRKAAGRYSNGAAIAPRCPQNQRIEVKFKRTGLIRREPALQLRIEVVSDLERQIFPGFETEPRGEGLVRERIGDLSRLSLPRESVRLDVLASTTGWDADARALVRGERGSEVRAGSRWGAILVDLRSDEVIASPAHEGAFAPILDLVRPSVRLDVAAEIAAYVRETLVGRESLPEGTLVEKFRAPREIVQAVFRSLAQTGEYEVREVRGVGMVLVRRFECP